MRSFDRLFGGSLVVSIAVGSVFAHIACATDPETDAELASDQQASTVPGPAPTTEQPPAPGDEPSPNPGDEPPVKNETPPPIETAPPPFEITDDIKFDQGELEVSTPKDGKGTELKRTVYVVKFGRDNHVSDPGKEFDNDASESKCGDSPPLCTSSQYHGYGRSFEVKVTCDKDGANPTAKFDTSLGGERVFPKTETGHTHLLNGYACAKSTGFGGAAVSAACRTKGLATISPQQVVAGAPAGNVFQELYVAYAATHCGRGLFENVPSFTCDSPEISVEAVGVGFKFQAKNQTYSGKKKVTCTADCGAAMSLDCKETEDGDI